MNAKEEFLRVTKDKTVICAILKQADTWCLDEDEIPWSHILKKGYSEEEYQEFLKNIDFDYDAGYGGQRVQGTIWLTNGEWFDRGEYDGSEWWEFHHYPDISEYLI